MRVRPLLLLTIAAAGISSPAFGQTMSSAASQGMREQTADQQVRHVLNRLAFGARPGDYDNVRQMGVDAWIDQQLHPEKISDAAATQFVAQLRTYLASPAELEREYPRPQIAQQQMARARNAADSIALRQEQRQAQQGARQMVAEAQAARLGRAVVGERQLEEVMVDFWLNHFSVYLQKNQQMRYYLASYDREVIRPRVFGKFRDLLGAVAHSPAMLIYLDNAQSVADTGRRTYVMQPGQDGRGRGGSLADRMAARGGRGPVGPVGNGQPPQQQRRASGLNENYGRELLELHTLGVDGGYTQKDVTEVSRALTGWSVVPPAVNQMDAPGGAGRGGRAAARPGRGRGGQVAAQYGVVTQGMFMFRGPAHDAEEKIVLGHKLKAGRGLEDGEEVLDIIARHPSTARYIATKLARRFVGDDPPPALVKRAADVFLKSDGNIRDVVRVIITSPEFFASAAYRSKVKTPFEVVASAMRAVGAPADATPRSAQLLATLGQPIFGRQTPDGWPEVGSAWVNTGSILNRINFGTAVAAGRVPGSNPSTWPLPLGINRASHEEQVDAVIAAFLGGEASPETRSILISGTNPLLAAVKPDSGGMGRVPPDSVANAVAGMSGADLARAQGGRAFQQLPLLEGVPQIVGLALGSPEFQRR